MSDYLYAADIKQLVDIGVVREIIVEGKGREFEIVVKTGMSERRLKPAHGKERPRTFKSADAVIRFIRHDLKFPKVLFRLEEWE